MGSLAGHVLPGCFFLAYGLIWAFLSIWMQLKTKAPNAKKNKKEGAASSSSSFFEYKRDHRLVRKSWIPLPYCPRIPLEPILKVLLTLVGIIAEAFFDFRTIGNKQRLITIVYHVVLPNGHLNDLAKLHHITMYGGFLLSGIVDIVSLFVKLPRQTSQLFLSIAFWTEWMLFYSHSDANDPLNIHTHFILTLVIMSCVVFSALRMFQASYFLINMGLAFSIMLQGTWFIQVGVSLYPPSGTNVLIESVNTHGAHGHDDYAMHSVTMYVYALFTWHVMLLAVSFLGLWVAMACFVRCGIHRRLAKRTPLKSNSLVDSDENERLIAVDESGKTSDLSIGIELQEVAETAS